jgi:hypothetical protein
MMRTVHVTVVVAAFAGVATVASIDSARATSDVFDPTVSALDEPILDRLAGDDIPYDEAGLGGSMFDRLPRDERTALERQIEMEVITSLNFERAQRGLWPYTSSDHVSAILHRWVRMMSSDVDDYPSCPVAVQADPPVKSCDAAGVNFDWFDFVNPNNGDGATLTGTSGGAGAGAAGFRPGAFVAGLLAAGGLHAADVLGFDARFAGVGLKCLPDGRTYLVWNAVDYDTGVLFADPASYEGPVVPAFTPTNFGHRCPQPGPAVSTSVSGASVTVTPVANTVMLTTGRHAIDGPVLGADLSTWTIEATFTHSSAPARVVSQALYTPAFEFAPVTVHDLAPGAWTVSVRLANAYETTQATVAQFHVTLPVVAEPESLRFSPVTPYRQADTRSGTALEAGETRAFVLDAPPGARAATLNVTAVHPAADGFLQVFPCGAAAVEVSSANYTADLAATPNQVTVGLDGEQRVCVSTYAPTDVIVDVAGWWTSSGSSVESVRPTRLRDTRPHGVSGGQTVVVDLDGLAPADATAVSLNVTSTRSTTPGFITVWPCDDAMPIVSNLNPSPGVDRPNHVTVAIGTSRRVCVYTHEATDVVVDLTGWWTSAGSTGLRVLASPERVHDTRTTPGARLAAMHPSVVIPTGARTVVANVTVDRTAAAGWLAVFPCADGWAGSSNVNFRAGGAASTAVLVDASRGGVCVVADQAADVIVDVFGEIT